MPEKEDNSAGCFYCGNNLWIYELFKSKAIKDGGVFTKATVINLKGYNGGIIITLNYVYRGKEYARVVNSDRGKSNHKHYLFRISLRILKK